MLLKHFLIGMTTLFKRVEEGDPMKMISFHLLEMSVVLLRTELENTLEITAENCMEPVHEPFIIVTGTIGFGEVPEPVQSFFRS